MASGRLACKDEYNMLSILLCPGSLRYQISTLPCLVCFQLSVFCRGLRPFDFDCLKGCGHVSQLSIKDIELKVVHSMELKHSPFHCGCSNSLMSHQLTIWMLCSSNWCTGISSEHVYNCTVVGLSSVLSSCHADRQLYGYTCRYMQVDATSNFRHVIGPCASQHTVASCSSRGCDVCGMLACAHLLAWAS